MNPATPVTTQTFGAETSCSRRRRYEVEITISQSKGTRRAVPRVVVRGSAATRLGRLQDATCLADASKHLPFPAPRLAPSALSHVMART